MPELLRNECLDLVYLVQKLSLESGGVGEDRLPVISHSEIMDQMCIRDRLIGSAQRVPVPTGSTTILTAVVKKAGVTKEDINAAMKAAASESFGYNEDAIVSSDVIGMKFGSLFDATQTMVAPVSYTHLDVYKRQVLWSAWLQRLHRLFS